MSVMLRERTTKVRFFHVPEFDDPEQEDALMADLPVNGRPTFEQEQHLFRKFSYCRFRAKTNSDWLAEAKKVKDLIFGLYEVMVIKFAKESRRSKKIDLTDYISDGNMSLMSAIDRFDYRLGNRFSSYAVTAITRRVYKVNRDSIKLDREKALSFDVRSNARSESDYLEEIEQNKALVTKALEKLHPNKRRIIEAVFFEGKGHEEVGTEFQLTASRIQQIKSAAIQEMKKVIGEI